MSAERCRSIRARKANIERLARGTARGRLLLLQRVARNRRALGLRAARELHRAVRVVAAHIRACASHASVRQCRSRSNNDNENAREQRTAWSASAVSDWRSRAPIGQRTRERVVVQQYGLERRLLLQERRQYREAVVLEVQEGRARERLRNRAVQLVVRQVAECKSS